MDTLLPLIIKNEELHKKWINTLSYMEHIGSRKIIKSQNSKKLNLDTLQHICEEARHAFFLKNIGHKHFKNFCPTFETSYLLGERAADSYFQNLDEFITGTIAYGSHFSMGMKMEMKTQKETQKKVQEKPQEETQERTQVNTQEGTQNYLNNNKGPSSQNPLCYFYVTLIVEIRALDIYTLYNQILSENQFKFKLTPLIVEEEVHLKDTRDWIKKNDPLMEPRISEFTQKESQLFEEFKKSIESEVFSSLSPKTTIQTTSYKESSIKS